MRKRRTRPVTIRESQKLVPGRVHEIHGAIISYESCWCVDAARLSSVYRPRNAPMHVNTLQGEHRNRYLHRANRGFRSDGTRCCNVER